VETTAKRPLHGPTRNPSWPSGPFSNWLDRGTTQENMPAAKIKAQTAGVFTATARAGNLRSWAPTPYGRPPGPARPTIPGRHAVLPATHRTCPGPLRKTPLVATGSPHHAQRGYSDCDVDHLPSDSLPSRGMSPISNRDHPVMEAAARRITAAACSERILPCSSKDQRYAEASGHVRRQPPCGGEVCPRSRPSHEVPGHDFVISLEHRAFD
jgi:hypothetical protein